MAKPTGVYLIHGDMWATDKPIGPFASEEGAYEFDLELEREDVGLVIDFTKGVVNPETIRQQRREEEERAARKAPYPLGVEPRAV